MTVTFAFDGSKTTISYNSPTGALAGLSGFTFNLGSEGATFTSGNLVHIAYIEGFGLGEDRWTFGGTSTPTWGTGSASNLTASSSSGDTFAIVSNGFWVTHNYDLLSGAPLSGSMTFLDTSLVDLGFSANTDASGSFTVAGTTVNWTATAVPEPGTTAAVAALAAVAIVAFSRSRRSVNRPPES